MVGRRTRMSLGGLPFLVTSTGADEHARRGDAILAAQRTYAETGLMPELLTVYHLLGDAATRIR